MSLERADEIVRQLWAKDVKAWDRYWVPIFRRFAHHLVSDSGVSSGDLVLDIGAGTGVAAFEAAKRTKPDGFVLGIDRLPHMIVLAKANRGKHRFRNVRFLPMNSRRLLFPDGMFDAVMSNCGISPVGFHETIREAFRVLRKGGMFVYNDWRLIDVAPHQVFGEILQQYRTNNPSRMLKLQRTALAALERFGNRELNPQAQVQTLRMAGFTGIEIKPRNYGITLPSIEAYLAMRLNRAALKEELKELSPEDRRILRHAFKQALRPFKRGRRFIFNWKVTFTIARK